MASTARSTDYDTSGAPLDVPPVISDAVEAATRPDRQGDNDFPGNTPDEVQPQQEEPNEPGQSPDEVNPGGGDWDEPDSSPIETPEPRETPAAPD